MRRRRDISLVSTIFAAIALALFLPSLGTAGSLEPPSYAVDGSGNPVPTMTTPPAWSQKLPTSERFVVLADFNNEAVLDKETGLVWEQSPGSDTFKWLSARLYCARKEVAGRKGWRLPTVEELASLVDSTNANALPSNHPFSNIQLSQYWSSTTWHDTGAYVVFFGPDPLYPPGGYGFVDGWGKQDWSFPAWCVRGGQGLDGNIGEIY